jgi:hypothetical protein
MIDAKRHADALRLRLDELVHRGFTIVHTFELYAWYGRQRLTQGVFRHLLETYDEIAGDKRRLSVLTGEGFYLLVESGRLENPSKAFKLEKD